jgi:hypothetical protein
MYLIDLLMSLVLLPISDGMATMGHEEDNVNYRENDSRGLYTASASSRCNLAESGIDKVERCAGFSSHRSREYFEKHQEKVTLCSMSTSRPSMSAFGRQR